MTGMIIAGMTIAAFACLYFLTQRPLVSSYKILSVFMLFLVLPMLEKMLLMRIIGIPYLHFSIFFGSALTFGPFLYLYTRSEVDRDARFSMTSLLHFIPFCISLCLLIVLGVNMPRHRLPAEANDMVSGRIPGEQIMPIINTGILLSLAAYTLLIFSLLRRHRRNITDYFSYDSIAINLKWLNWITVFFCISYAAVFVPFIIVSKITGAPQTDPGFMADISTSFFIFVFSFCAMKQPVIFKEYPGRPVPQAEGETDAKKMRYSKSGLKERDARKYLAMLDDYMRSEKPYRNAEITIADVASALHIPKHHITQVINEKLQKNFYHYINGFRIEEVKQMMADTRFSGYSVLRMAYDSGFNSKSAFNVIFKKIAGTTPSEYKKTVHP